MSDSSYGTVTVGRLTLRETFEVKADVHAGYGKRTITMTGEESCPPLTMSQLLQRNEDIMTMRDMVMPITWTNKSVNDGFYIVEDVSAGLIDYIGGIAKFSWQIRAHRYGPANSCDIESRLTGISRQNVWELSGVRWHSPAIGYYAYFTGSTRAGLLFTRVGEDGFSDVFTELPDDFDPRWSIAANAYRSGRSRIKIDGIERTGTNVKDGTTWELTNGIVNVSPASSGGLSVGSYNGADYDEKVWDVSIGTSEPTMVDYSALSIIRNDFEMVTIRLVRDEIPGRSMVDLSLRRGSRFVEGYIETDVSTTIGLKLRSGENGSAPSSAGYVVATSDDSDGNKAIVGTAQTFTADTSDTGISKTSSVKLDFFLGVVYGGSSANIGDEAGDLMDQYIGATAEMTMAVLR